MDRPIYTRRYTLSLTGLAGIFLAIYYTWYSLPFMRVTFQTATHKSIFFACFLVGMLLLTMARLRHNALTITFGPWRSILVPIILYMLVMAALYLLDVGDASRHIRISFTFWGTAIVYHLFSFDRTAQARFGKLLLLLFCLTAITSVIGVFVDNSAARAIANASQREESLARDYVLMRRNISGVYLFQSLVVASPVALLMILRRRKPYLGVLLLLAIIAAVARASFSIALLVLVIGCILAVLSHRKLLGTFLLLLSVLLLLLLPMDTILSGLANRISNPYFSSRLHELSLFFGEQQYVSGDLYLRTESYLYSLNTALEHPLGTGAWYDYVIGAHGIGYHSEILDDLARYGIFACAFYVMFFREYVRLLRRQWAKVGFSCVVFPVCMVYGLFLLLNIGFRSADESIFMLYILPALPDILLLRRGETEAIV